MHQWQKWHSETRAALEAISLDANNQNYTFLDHHYRRNHPLVMRLPYWKAFDWTIPYLQEKVGKEYIEFQGGRSCNVDYEVQSNQLRKYGSFNLFIDLMTTGPQNDVYITANNHVFNKKALKPLYADIGALPPFLRNVPEDGFFWIGADTTTPLHHDLTNNFMCQLMGEKLVRCVPPDQFDKIDYRTGVHSNIGWLTEEYAEEHAINYIDFHLHSGEALFLPIGWWHSIKSFGISASVVYTNFIWNNSFFHNFVG